MTIHKKKVVAQGASISKDDKTVIPTTRILRERENNSVTNDGCLTPDNPDIEVFQTHAFVDSSTPFNLTTDIGSSTPTQMLDDHQQTEPTMFSCPKTIPDREFKTVNQLEPCQTDIDILKALVKPLLGDTTGYHIMYQVFDSLDLKLIREDRRARISPIPHLITAPEDLIPVVIKPSSSQLNRLTVSGFVTNPSPKVPIEDFQISSYFVRFDENGVTMKGETFPTLILALQSFCSTKKFVSVTSHKEAANESKKKEAEGKDIERS